MAAPTNKFDITEGLKNVPSPVFDAILIHTLLVDTSEFQNNKDIDDLKRNIANYYGVQLVLGHWEVKPELSADAKLVAQDLIDNFLK